MSGHADTIRAQAEFRNEVDCLRNLADDDMASVSVDLLRLAADAQDSLVADANRYKQRAKDAEAENQWLRAALDDAPSQWVDDADLFVKYTAWLESIGGERR